MFGKLKKLFKPHQHNPCEDWEVKSIQTPHLETAQQKVGELRFGDAVTKASCYGKPDELRNLEGGAYNLVYAKAGFQLEFDQDLLSSVAYFVGPDTFDPKSANLVYARSTIDSLAFDKHTDSAQIIAVFGDAREVDKDSEETILYYDLSKLTVEFELSTSDALKRVNVYPR